jgi:hypothetical protein
MRTLINILLLSGILTGCSGGGSKKLTLPSEKEMNKNIEKFSYTAAIVMDTLTPTPGVKWKEVRKTDAANPPVTIRLASNPEEKDFKLTDYFKKVTYVKLKHPYREQLKGFLGDASVSVSYPAGGNNYSSGVNSNAYLTSGYIIAGDQYFGYHCYDNRGEFLYTLAVRAKMPSYDKRENSLEYEYDEKEDQVYSFQVQGDNCLIFRLQNEKPVLDFHNLTSRKTYLSRPFHGGHPQLINSETFVNSMYNLRATERRPFMYALEMKGDTLCRFMNYNKLFDDSNKGQYTTPDRGISYYYNNLLTFRQAYNDTLYRITAPNELTAAYVLDFGKQAWDVNIAMYGDKTDKLIPKQWVETDQFIFIVHTRNNDTPYNRKNNTVQFFYSFYDKAEQKLFRIPATAFPDNLLLSNELNEGIPFRSDFLTAHDNKLYVKYTKNQLERLMNNENFASLPAAQKDRVSSLHKELEVGELLLVILE